MFSRAAVQAALGSKRQCQIQRLLPNVVSITPLPSD